MLGDGSSTEEEASDDELGEGVKGAAATSPEPVEGFTTWNSKSSSSLDVGGDGSSRDVEELEDDSSLVSMMVTHLVMKKGKMKSSSSVVNIRMCRVFLAISLMLKMDLKSIK